MKKMYFTIKPTITLKKNHIAFYLLIFDNEDFCFLKKVKNYVCSNPGNISLEILLQLNPTCVAMLLVSHVELFMEPPDEIGV